MRTLPSLSGLLVCLGLLSPAAARAADVAVFAPEISNLSSEDASALGELIAQAYAATSQRDVVPPSVAQPARADAPTYEAAAASLSVAEYIRISAVAAGKRVVITAGRYEANGQLLKQARKTADNVDELPLAADEVAKELWMTQAMPVSAPAQPPPPALPPPTFRAPKKDDVVYGIKAGVHLPFARGGAYYSALSLQFDGRLQFPRFFLEFGAGFLIPTVIDNQGTECTFDSASNTSTCINPDAKRGHVGGITTELGASYYLTQTSVQPYLGGGVIPRVILAGMNSGDDHNRDIASMSAYVQFGMTFPRESTTRFMFDVRLAQALLPQHLENDTKVWPTEPSLHAGIGW